MVVDQMDVDHDQSSTEEDTSNPSSPNVSDFEEEDEDNTKRTNVDQIKSEPSLLGKRKRNYNEDRDKKLLDLLQFKVPRHKAVIKSFENRQFALHGFPKHFEYRIKVSLENLGSIICGLPHFDIDTVLLYSIPETNFIKKSIVHPLTRTVTIENFIDGLIVLRKSIGQPITFSTEDTEKLWDSLEPVKKAQKTEDNDTPTKNHNKNHRNYYKKKQEIPQYTSKPIIYAAKDKKKVKKTKKDINKTKKNGIRNENEKMDIETDGNSQIQEPKNNPEESTLEQYQKKEQKSTKSPKKSKQPATVEQKDGVKSQEIKNTQQTTPKTTPLAPLPTTPKKQTTKKVQATPTKTPKNSKQLATEEQKGSKSPGIKSQENKITQTTPKTTPLAPLSTKKTKLKAKQTRKSTNLTPKGKKQQNKKRRASKP